MYRFKQFIYKTGSIKGYVETCENDFSPSKKHYYVKVNREGKIFYLTGLHGGSDGELRFVDDIEFALGFTEMVAIRIANMLRKKNIAAFPFSLTKEA